MIWAAATAGWFARRPRREPRRAAEISPPPYFLAQILLPRQGKNRRKIKMHYQDLWRADLRRADIVYLFLLPGPNRKMRGKLEPGARVIACVADGGLDAG